MRLDRQSISCEIGVLIYNDVALHFGGGEGEKERKRKRERGEHTLFAVCVCVSLLHSYHSKCTAKKTSLKVAFPLFPHLASPPPTWCSVFHPEGETGRAETTTKKLT